MKITSHKDLLVWQKSIDLVEEVFILTKNFPKSEIYGIISQMRRAVVGIPSCIAEGYGRQSPKEYAQFLSVAYASSLELETQIIIAKRLKLAPAKNFEKAEEILMEVTKMLYSLRRKIKQ